MNCRFDNKDSLCRVGPGGEYVSNWSPGPAQSRRSGSLRELLTSMAWMANLAIGVGTAYSLADSTRPVCAEDEHDIDEEYTQCAVEQGVTAQVLTPRSMQVLINRVLPGEPILLAYHCRTGRRTRHQLRHRIPAHRRVAQRRPASGSPWQSTYMSRE